ncbi:MAG: hypothetical protein FWF67_03985 [Fibromonadales bacterium]|nr:hypothetical protein [Fibromonadales bacterium]
MVLRFLLIAFLLLLGCSGEDLQFNNPNDPRNFSHPSGIAYQPFTDPRDGRTYNSVVIGEQTWMAENLNYVPPWEGAKDDFPCAGTDNVDYEKETLVSDGDYCDIYGRLYKWWGWDIAINACPSGWHLPSATEWQILLMFIDPNFSDYSQSSQASSKLRATSSGWPSYFKDKGTDDYGFTAIYFLNRYAGEGSCWWSSTREERGRNEAYSLIFYSPNTSSYNRSDEAGVFKQDYTRKCSIRCVKDGGPTSLPGSSSSVPSTTSSSSKPSSSSTPSSSSAGCTAANNTSTQYCSNGTIKTYGTMTDNDGRNYKTVVIGTQTWMAENMNYDASGSVCYDYNDEKCKLYGKLYYWETAMEVCPSASGWHLPSDAEWITLVNYVEEGNGCSNCAGKYLKAKEGWNNDGNGENKYGFSALPSGQSTSGYFSNVGRYGYWWSTGDNYNSWGMHNNNAKLDVTAYDEVYLFSVRCVKGSN